MASVDDFLISKTCCVQRAAVGRERSHPDEAGPSGGVIPEGKEVLHRMKVKIAYLPEEEAVAAADLAALQLRHPDARIKTSDRHPPYKHIYLSVGGRINRCNSDGEEV